MASEIDRLDKFDAVLAQAGVDVFAEHLQGNFALTLDAFNVVGGIHKGLGPRYGMAPIPRHMDNEANSGNNLPGLRRSEVAYADRDSPGLYDRTKFYGVLNVKLGGVDSAINTLSDYYLWAVRAAQQTSVSGVSAVFDLILGGGCDSTVIEHESSFAGGLGTVWIDHSVTGLTIELMPTFNDSNSKRTNAAKLLALDSTVNFLSMSVLSVQGGDIPMQWIFGDVTATGDVDTAPSLRLYSKTFSAAALAKVNAGPPPEIIYGNWKKVRRSVNVFALTAVGARNMDYQVSFDPTSSIFVPRYLWNDTSVMIDLSTPTATKLTAGVTYSNTVAALYNDQEMVCNSSYKAALVATGSKGFAVIFQDWARNELGMMQQFVDLTNLPFEPPAIISTYQEGAAGDYAPSSFRDWPRFTRGTAMGTSGAGTGLGTTEGEGLLRANSVYEFTYSIYNKRLNFETNVGKPVKIQTGANDFVKLILFNNTSSGAPAGNGTVASTLEAVAEGCMPWIGNGTRANNPYDLWNINYLEYRFYYRMEGMTEWLPALFIDAPKFWFYPRFLTLDACTGGIGGLPGGRPGGFVDYSRLPDDKYNCVVTFRNRAFWFSDKGFVFSLYNNVFAYPQRNSMASPEGTFRGGTVHTFEGDVDERSRLIVWGSKESYIGRFTGSPTVVPVQVSVETIAEFPLDGSDFVLEPWCSHTAFSHRAAVIANGTLYFWGPDGIFMDGGTRKPVPIGDNLEPDLATLYDTNKTNEIHAVYNATTREVIWFYPPKTADGYATHALVLDLDTGRWLPQKFLGKIDHAQPIEVKTSLKTAGKRILVSQRYDASASTQRGYFFDQRNRSGDMRPTTELMVKSFTTPSAGRRRLTLAAGYDATNFGTIAVGDRIVFQQLNQYATSLTDADDFVGTVEAVNAGAGTIDVIVPDDADIDASATLSNGGGTYFPVWHATEAGAGLNGITWQAPSKYWLPNGVEYSALWTHLYLLAKVRMLPATRPQTINVAYRTPVSTAQGSTDITLADNMDGAFQRLLRLDPSDRATDGQALKVTFSGVQVASELVLQYLKIYGEPQDNVLKEFEE